MKDLIRRSEEQYVDKNRDCIAEEVGTQMLAGKRRSVKRTRAVSGKVTSKEANKALEEAERSESDSNQKVESEEQKSPTLQTAWA